MSDKFNDYGNHEIKHSSIINKDASRYQGNFYGQGVQRQLRQRIMSSNNQQLKNDINNIKSNGYVILRNLLSKDKSNELYKESHSLLEDTPFGRNEFEGRKTKRVYSIIGISRKYDDVILHKRINDILDYFLLPDYLLSVSQLIDIYPQETQQNFHRDSGAYIYSHYPRIEYPFRFTTIWALDNFTLQNGATKIIPKSHLIPNDINIEKYIKDNKDKAIPVILNAGDCILFVGGLFHCGGANKTNKSRKAITIQYCQPWLRQQENALLAVPLDMIPTLNKKLQRLIGYGMYGGYGVVNGTHPLKAIPKLLDRYSKL